MRVTHEIGQGGVGVLHGCADRRHLENGTAADDSGVRREGMEQGQYGNWINLGAG